MILLVRIGLRTTSASAAAITAAVFTSVPCAATTTAFTWPTTAPSLLCHFDEFVLRKETIVVGIDTIKNGLHPFGQLVLGQFAVVVFILLQHSFDHLFRSTLGPTGSVGPAWSTSPAWAIGCTGPTWAIRPAGTIRPRATSPSWPIGSTRSSGTARAPGTIPATLSARTTEPTTHRLEIGSQFLGRQDSIFVLVK
jgi:hypothetical protein